MDGSILRGVDTLTFTDLKNRMDYSTASATISGGIGSTGEGATDADGNPTQPSAGDQFRNIGHNIVNGNYGEANYSSFNPGIPVMQSGSDTTLTRATLTEGNIKIGGKTTTAAATGINTDASAAHEAVAPLPDVRKILGEQQALAAATGTVMTTAKEIGDDIAAAAERKADAIEATYIEGLDTQDKRDAFNALTADQRRDVVAQSNPEYSAAYDSKQHWGIGGDYSRALQAVTTVVVGGVSGQSAGQVATNALAPYAAQLIGKTFDQNHGSNPNAVLQGLSHAVLGAVLAQVNGGSLAGGALAGASGELAAQYLTKTLYGDDPRAIDPVTGKFNPNLLPEKDKQLIVALSQAVGALAGGMTGGNLNDALVGSGVAGNAVENNFLGNAQKQRLESLRAKSEADGLTPQEAKELVILDVSDQVSDGLLARYRAGEHLTAADMENLKLYLGAYAAQNGIDAASDLIKNGSASTSEFPYAGLGADERAYANANFTWKDMLFGHDKSANEQIFADARMKSGLSYISAPNESLTPFAMELSRKLAVLDAIGDGVSAAIVYGVAEATGTRAETRDFLTLTVGQLSDIGASVILPRTGILVETSAKVPGIKNLPTVNAVVDAAVVSEESTGIKFGGGVQAQGKPFEDFVQSRLPSGTIDLNLIKPSFSTFDHFTPDGIAVSDKKLDTMSKTYLTRPETITRTLNGYVDNMVGFYGDKKGSFELNPERINGKQMQLAIPDETTAAQIDAIKSSIDYAGSKGVKIIITRVK
ncbi:VENN motif pre-toxin domain-containing protein [Xanthomonas dyei]|uniref:endonuclease toxin domain-containing protein n=1 Tax=Xanthomonas dyei TaxID=743699 RepID=UPI001E5C270B|nr:VENN motif pre-toxin domain-containing protein [Xanthomonas dyei]MCC4634508.1 VENN motif pre-toxin domain-containing protein [Xanthomonas dyei pv. eucalypti]